METRKERTLYYCIKCGVRFTGQSGTCPVCGNPEPRWDAVKICRGCGRQVPKDAVYCCWDGGRQEP